MGRKKLTEIEATEAAPVSHARAREARIAAKEKGISLMKNRTKRILAPALAPLVILRFFVVPGVRAAAVEFLGMFRVEQVRPVRCGGIG